MARTRSLVSLLGAALLAPVLAAADTDRPLVSELEAGPSCGVPQEDPAVAALQARLLPHVPLEVQLDPETLEQYQREGLVVLNNRGYNYRPSNGGAPTASRAAAATPAPARSKR